MVTDYHFENNGFIVNFGLIKAEKHRVFRHL